MIVPKKGQTGGDMLRALYAQALQNNTPIIDPVQGLADAGGKIGLAFLAAQEGRREKDEEKQKGARLLEALKGQGGGASPAPQGAAQSGLPSMPSAPQAGPQAAPSPNYAVAQALLESGDVANAMEVLTALSKQQQPRPPAPVKLGAGDVLVDPTTGRQIASLPAAEPKLQISNGVVIDPKTGDLVRDYRREPTRAQPVDSYALQQIGGKVARVNRRTGQYEIVDELSGGDEQDDEAAALLAILDPEGAAGEDDAEAAALIEQLQSLGLSDETGGERAEDIDGSAGQDQLAAMLAGGQPPQMSPGPMDQQAALAQMLMGGAGAVPRGDPQADQLAAMLQQQQIPPPLVAPTGMGAAPQPQMPQPDQAALMQALGGGAPAGGGMMPGGALQEQEQALMAALAGQQQAPAMPPEMAAPQLQVDSPPAARPAPAAARPAVPPQLIAGLKSPNRAVRKAAIEAAKKLLAKGEPKPSTVFSPTGEPYQLTPDGRVKQVQIEVEPTERLTVQGGAPSPDGDQGTDLVTAVGPGPVTADFISRIVGGFVPGVGDEAVTRARQDMRILERSAREAFTIGSRPSMWEQKLAQQVFPSEGFFESPDRARIFFEQLEKDAVQQFNDNADLLDSPSIKGSDRVDLMMSQQRLKRLVAGARAFIRGTAGATQDASAARAPQNDDRVVPAPLPPPEQRVPGQTTIQTPAGNLMWDGQGWVAIAGDAGQDRLEAAPPAEQAAPEGPPPDMLTSRAMRVPGRTYDGWVYQGGNPRDPASWRRAQ